MSEDFRGRIATAIERYNAAKAKMTPELHAFPMKALDHIREVEEWDAAWEPLRGLCSHPTVVAEYCEVIAMLDQDREIWIEARSVCRTKDSPGGPRRNTRTWEFPVCLPFWGSTKEQLALDEARKEIADARVDRPIEAPRPVESYTLSDFIEEYTWQKGQLQTTASRYAGLWHVPKGLDEDQRKEHEIRKQKSEDECSALRSEHLSARLRNRMIGALKNTDPRFAPQVTFLVNEAFDLRQSIVRDIFMVSHKLGEFYVQIHKMEDAIKKLRGFVAAQGNQSDAPNRNEASARTGIEATQRELARDADPLAKFADVRLEKTDRSILQKIRRKHPIAATYDDMELDVPGISRPTISARLPLLIEKGIITRTEAGQATFTPDGLRWWDSLPTEESQKPK